MTLRLRLMLALVALVVIGLSTIDAVTYLTLESSLSQQMDSQLTSSANSVYRCLELKYGPEGNPNALCVGLYVPVGTYGALVPISGGTPLSITVHQSNRPAVPGPRLPPAFGTDAGAAIRFTTAPAISGGGEFRVLEVADGAGSALVVAMPLANVDATLSQLRLLEALVSAVILLALASLAWWMVQLGLSPLRRIGDTAKQIAAGDLSQRVDSVDPRTEVGQLGMSLNEMLAQIEHAFEARTASEERLRQFVADASHELRTPLSSIRGYAELFRRGARSNPEDLGKAMSRIESESIRMGQLVDDLLLLARLDEDRPLDLRPVDLTQLAFDAAADQAAADRHHPIVVAAPEPVLVAGDEARLRQVVTNLVRNAVVHTPDGTAIQVLTASEGDRGILEVVDHGPGVPAEAAGRIFERFVRVDGSRGRARGGAGLGLAIVAAIVASHRGEVSLLPTPGGGATFRVAIPRAAPLPPEPPGRAEPASTADPSPEAAVPSPSET
ncbi:MAG: HAMP domain-containing histidine kinase [Candidatus Dormibacteraeota bacterium]|nr:HAMP domain-containing histidine kinase [Candidatus Dormibacteraeota bacterium]